MAGEIRRDGSLPVWEEWIEIALLVLALAAIARLFPYGKSGLKYPARPGAGHHPRLFPYGKSGLKWIPGNAGAQGAAVSSRMGRVD